MEIHIIAASPMLERHYDNCEACLLENFDCLCSCLLHEESHEGAVFIHIKLLMPNCPTRVNLSSWASFIKTHFNVPSPPQCTGNATTHTVVCISVSRMCPWSRYYLLIITIQKWITVNGKLDSSNWPLSNADFSENMANFL